MRVKICGVRRLEDAILACELGAAAIGFVFWPESPRFIDPYRARTIAAALPPFVTPVGVFVDQPVDYVIGVAKLVRLGAIQLHGQEPPTAYVGCNVPIVKAVPVMQGVGSSAAVDAVPPGMTILLDAHDPVRRGGTGQTVDWTFAATVARTRRIVLAGGLTAQNVTHAIAQVQPYAVDVSSGVESAPGVKDERKLHAFFAAVESGRRAVAASAPLR
jgi:phosphoribosylanthranilate isomerase